MGDVVAPDLEELRAFTARLRCVGPWGEAALGIEWLDAVEALKSVGCAVQAVVADDVATCMREDRNVRGLPRAEWDRGIASQIALARRESPNRGGRHLGFARAVVHEMPHTLALLRSGRLNEWRATLLVGETAGLSAADRKIVDHRLCSDPNILDGVGDRGLVAKAKALAVELDAAGAGFDGVSECADADGTGRLPTRHIGSRRRQPHRDRGQRWPHPESGDGGSVVRPRHRGIGGIGGAGGGELGDIRRGPIGG